MHILSLSSSSIAGNAYLVWGGDSRPILVDCGVSIRRLVTCLHEYGISPEDIAGLFITHEHYDHIKAMCLVTPFAQKYRIPVYASPGFWGWYARYLPRLDPNLVHSISSGQTVSVDRSKIQAFSKPHDAQDPLGFVVECDHERVGFAMDLGHVTPDIEKKLRGLEHLVFESNHDVGMERRSGRHPYLIERVLGKKGHLSNDQAALALKTMVTDNTKQVILAHLSVECNTQSLARATVETCLRQCGKHAAVYVAPAKDPMFFSDPSS